MWFDGCVVMTDQILFYRVGDEYGEFSNFAPYPIRVDGKRWPTTEHYFQAQKFLAAEHQLAIRKAKGPMRAAKMGRDRKRPLRRDWERVKDDVMYRALRAKFTQHEELRALLLGTGEAKLIEHTRNDRYWADGGDDSGKNMLGVLLMRLRRELSR